MADSTNRTSSEAVAAIILVDTSNTPDLSPFIDTANAMVSQACVIDLASGVATGYSDAHLELIERWLAAHFYAIRDPRIQSQGFGGASGAFQGQTQFNLASTSYGQQALLLDYQGGLARLSEHVAKGKRGKVGLVSLSSNSDCNNKSYRDRP